MLVRPLPKLTMPTASATFGVKRRTMRWFHGESGHAGCRARIHRFTERGYRAPQPGLNPLDLVDRFATVEAVRSPSHRMLLARTTMGMLSEPDPHFVAGNAERT